MRASGYLLIASAMLAGLPGLTGTMPAHGAPFIESLTFDDHVIS